MVYPQPTASNHQRQLQSELAMRITDVVDGIRVSALLEQAHNLSRSC